MTPTDALTLEEAMAELDHQDMADRQQRASALVAVRKLQAHADAAAAQAEAERTQLAIATEMARAVQAQTDADLAHEWVELAYRQRDLLAAMSEQYRVPALDRLSAIWYEREILKREILNRDGCPRTTEPSRTSTRKRMWHHDVML
jgi:hypothetical protein